MKTNDKLIKSKLGLLNLAEKLGNVSHACKVMGYSRDSFYRIKQLYDTGGDEALHEISRSKPLLKNRVEPDVEEAIVKMAFDYPAYGQQRVCNELKKKGLFVSSGGVRSVWLRHDLEVFDKRLKALEAVMAQDGIILTEAQMIAIERKKEKKEACGEIETEHHEYELYLTIEGIEHTKTQVRTPQSNGICERLNRTIKEEFYSIAFRKKLYTTLEDLQADLDEYIKFYNTERPHSGRYCYGKTPMETFMDSKHLAEEKQINHLSLTTT